MVQLWCRILEECENGRKTAMATYVEWSIVSLRFAVFHFFGHGFKSPCKGVTFLDNIMRILRKKGYSFSFTILS